MGGSILTTLKTILKKICPDYGRYTSLSLTVRQIRDGQWKILKDNIPLDQTQNLVNEARLLDNSLYQDIIVRAVCLLPSGDGDFEASTIIWKNGKWKNYPLSDYHPSYD